jgi:hypothetical protein
MNTDLEALARRAVACPRWRWMPGMLVKYVGPPTELHPKGLELECRVRRVNWESSEDDLPDLSDPATLGCLLALVREQYQDATTQIDSGKWWVAAMNGTRVGMGPTEAEALVAALEAAP